MNLLERRVTRRGLLVGGFTFVGGIVAAACALRPEAKTVPPTLPAGATAPSPRPTEILRPTPQPPPTETPKTVEKDVIDGWRFAPVWLEFLDKVAIEQRYPDGYAVLREGYKRANIRMTIQNLSSSIYTIDYKVRGVSDLAFNIQATGGFSYPEEYSPNGRFSHQVSAPIMIPPRYSLPYDVEIDVPIIAKDLRLVLKSSNPRQTLSWNLQEFPTPEKAGKFEYLSPDKKDLKQLGKPLEQGPFRVTPLRTIMFKAYRSERELGGSWVLGIESKVENGYGYGLSNPDALFMVFDSKETIWNGFVSDFKFTYPPEVYQGIPEVSPGTTELFYVAGRVSKSYFYLREDFPSPPSKLRLLVVLPYLSKINGKETWALYDIGEPTISSEGFHARRTGLSAEVEITAVALEGTKKLFSQGK